MMKEMLDLHDDKEISDMEWYDHFDIDVSLLTGMGW
jgi:hypothetical protein